MSAYVDAYSALEIDGFAEGEQPFCDMTFDLVTKSIKGRRPLFGRDERVLSGEAMASTPRGSIGFRFEMESIGRWRLQKDEDLATAWGCITLRSLGEPTDRLVQEYEAWFGLDAIDEPAVNELKAAAVVIGGSPADFSKGKVHTKLFLHHVGEDETYAEVYLNLDMRAGRVELKEKDEEYRPRLIGWLRGRFGQPDREWLR